MKVNNTSKLDIDDLPPDIFEVADLGLTTRSLTTGHGITENGASCGVCGPCVCGSCWCAMVEPEEHEIH